MDVPGIVEEALDGEEVAASVDIGGDDGLFVTPTRTLIYRSEGLLSDESVESYSLEAESLSLSEGRRKTRITLEHPIEGVEEFTLPSSAADEAIPSILAGILGMNDVIGPDEAVVDTYLFSELTLVISDGRLVKHVGETVWDLEFEEYPFADVTGVYAEQGNVATQLVIEVDGRAERIKTPSDRSREVRETLEDALRRYHGLQPDDDLNDALAPAEPEPSEPDESADEDDAGSGAGGMDFGEGVDPLSAGDTTQDGRNPDPRDELAETAPAGSDDASAEGSVDAPAGDTGGEPSAVSESSGPESADSGTTETRSAATSAAPSEDAATASGTDETAGSGANASDATAGDAEASSEDGESSRTGDADAGATTGADTSADHVADDAARVADETDRAAEDVGRAPDEFEDAGFEPAADSSEELAEEVQELRVAVQKQNKLLARQHKTIEKLVEELRRGR